MKKKILEEKLFEASLHKNRLQSARKKLKFIMPLDTYKYSEIDDIFISINVKSVLTDNTKKIIVALFIKTTYYIIFLKSNFKI